MTSGDSPASLQRYEAGMRGSGRERSDIDLVTADKKSACSTKAGRCC